MPSQSIKGLARDLGVSEDIFAKSAAADDLRSRADFSVHWIVPTPPGSTAFQPSGWERNGASQ